MSYRDIITIEPDKRGGRPCIRRMRITVYDVLGWLAAGMSTVEIIDDFPELTETDIRACLEFAADRDHRLVALVSFELITHGVMYYFVGGFYSHDCLQPGLNFAITTESLGV